MKMKINEKNQKQLDQDWNKNYIKDNSLIDWLIFKICNIGYRVHVIEQQLGISKQKVVKNHEAKLTEDLFKKEVDKVDKVDEIDLSSWE